MLHIRKLIKAIIYTKTNKSYHLLAAQQEPYKKAYLLMNTTEEFSGKKARRMGH